MAKKRIINKRKPKPKPKVTAKQTKPEERLKQKQKQIVNVKVNIDQSKMETKDSAPKIGGHTSVINTYPLYQEQPRVPAIIFNNPTNTNPTDNTNRIPESTTNTTTNNYSQTNHYHRSHNPQTNDFQSPEEGVRNGFTYHRSHNTTHNQNSNPMRNTVTEIHALPSRQSEFHSPESQAATGNLAPSSSSRRNVIAGGGGNPTRVFGTDIQPSREFNSIGDVYHNSNDEFVFHNNSMRLNATPHEASVSVPQRVAEWEGLNNRARAGAVARGRQNRPRNLINPETNFPIAEGGGVFNGLIENGYTLEEINLFTELRAILPPDRRAELQARLRRHEDSIEDLTQEFKRR
jgi:hypothetical protein